MDEQSTVVDGPKVVETVVPAPAVEAPVAAPVVVDEVHFIPEDFEAPVVEAPVEDFPVVAPKAKKTRKPKEAKAVKVKKVVKTKTKKTSKLGRGHKICSGCGKPNGPCAFRCKFCNHKFKMNVEPKPKVEKPKVARVAKTKKTKKSKK